MTSDLKVAAAMPDLSGRKAKCDLCPSVEPSGRTLAFFGCRPEKEFDSYYCGCKGWWRVPINWSKVYVSDASVIDG